MKRKMRMASVVAAALAFVNAAGAQVLQRSGGEVQNANQNPPDAAAPNAPVQSRQPPAMLQKNYRLPPGYATNPFVLNTNQFSTNQFGANTNGVGSNQFGFNSNEFEPLAPTSRSSAGSRYYFTNGFNPAVQDSAYLPSDQQILLQIRQSVDTRLTPLVPPNGVVPVHIFVREGVVTLVGYVPTLQDKQRIAMLAQQTPGVVRVFDQLETTQPGAGSQTAPMQPLGAANPTYYTNLPPTSRTGLPPGLERRYALPPGLQR